MIPELGHFALILALAGGAGRAERAAAGRQLPRPCRLDRAGASGRVAAVRAGGDRLRLSHGSLRAERLLGAAGGRTQQHRAAPWYKVTAVWGNHEGSILMWALILSGWTVAVASFSRQLPAVMVARVIGIMGLISVGFLLFTLFTSNPFERLLPAAENGRDLNPLLQDPGMIFHPPLLYMGYVGFSVAFAFAVAALISLLG